MRRSGAAAQALIIEVVEAITEVVEAPDAFERVSDTPDASAPLEQGSDSLARTNGLSALFLVTGVL